MSDKPEHYDKFISIVLAEGSIILTKEQSDALLIVLLDHKKFAEHLKYTIGRALHPNLTKEQLTELYHLLSQFNKFSENKLYESLTYRTEEDWKMCIQDAESKLYRT